MKILVADDNPVFQSVLKVMVTNWGHDVEVACDGNEALQILQSESGPRLAILDWMMPGLEGVEVCRRIRSNPPGHFVYVVILTAKTGSEDLAAAMEAGADDFVSKPLKSQELRVRLRAARRILELDEHPVLPQEPIIRLARSMARLRLEIRRLSEMTRKRSLDLATARTDPGAGRRRSRSYGKTAPRWVGSARLIGGPADLTPERIGLPAVEAVFPNFDQVPRRHSPVGSPADEPMGAIETE